MDEHFPDPDRTGPAADATGADDGTEPDDEEDAADAAQHAQELLAEHVPLTLLVDLLTPTGDTSADLLAAEGLPDDAWWEPPADEDAPDA